MRKIISLVLVPLLAFLLGVFNIELPCARAQFTLLSNGNIVAPDGTEYVHLANEGFVATFGSHTLIGKVKGEVPWFIHLTSRVITGMYSCEGDSDYNVLMRKIPFNEWGAYYRKASLSPIVLSIDNCERFEIIRESFPGIEHLTCGDGISSDDAAAFLADLRNQTSPEEAGFVGGSAGIPMVRGYGFLKNEPNLAIPFWVAIYGEQAFSIQFADEREFVLPEKWFRMMLAEE